MPDAQIGETKIRCAIIGGGIGGLVAAIALSQKGVDVNVYERTPSFKEIGAGVSLGPNSRRLLERLGFAEALGNISPEVKSGVHRILKDYRTGEIKQVKKYSSAEEVTSRVLRSELLDMLKRAMPEHALHSGKRCISLDQKGSTVHVTFEDGSTINADVVIGADGIHSVVREKFYADRPVFSNEIAYRSLVDMADLDGIVNPEDINEGVLWCGPERRILTYPISKNGRTLNVIGFFPPASNEDYVESYRAEGQVQDLLAQVEDWSPVIRQILSKVKVVGKWALYDREILPKWTFGQITLLGDAAHAMLPHQGQGAGQSIEDGYTLALCLGDSTLGNIPQALTLYESLRKPRVEQAQSSSRALGKLYASYDFNANFRKAYEGRWSWLWDYDIDKAYEKAKLEVVAT